MGVRRLGPANRRHVVLLVVAASVLCALPSTALALSTHVFSSSFGSPGAEAGQLSFPAGVGIDATTHDVYVADEGNRRIDEFEPSGASFVFVRAWGWGVADGLSVFETCSLSCHVGVSGTGLGQFTTPAFVAVDNSSGASAGDVYVGDTGDNVVSKFTPEGVLVESWGGKGQLDGSSTGAGSFGSLVGVAVGSSATGNLYVLNKESRMFQFEQDGAFVGELKVARGTTTGGLAVDSAGDFFKVNGDQSVEEITGSDSDLGQVTLAGESLGGPTKAVGLALGGSGDLYVAEPGVVGHYAFPGLGAVSEPDGASCAFASFSGCGPTDTFGSGKLSVGSGIGVDPSNEHVYVADASANVVNVFVAGVIPDLTTLAASGVGLSGASLHGEVNPDGLELTECKFEYGTDTSYGQSVPCEQLPASIGSGTSPVPVSASISGLLANTVYHFRVVATNKEGQNAGEDKSLTTLSPPLIDSTFAGNVTSSSATLGAQINALGTATEYHFDYGTTTSYGASIPIPDRESGSGEGDQAVFQHIQELSPNTIYHYRVVAHNVFGSVIGPDQAFMTQASGSAFELPDGRQWEMVSPPDKRGSPIKPLGVLLTQAAGDGRAMSYIANAPTEAQPAGYTEFAQVFSARGPSGWVSHDLTVTHSGAPGFGSGNEFRFFSEDLSSSIVDPAGNFVPSLSSEASDNTPYLYTDFVSGNVSDPCVSMCYRPLVTGRPGYANVRSGAKFGPEGTCPTTFCGPVFVGGSPDLSHVIVQSDVGLSSLSGDEGGLYEWTAGKQLEPVSVSSADTVVNGAFLGGEKVGVSDGRNMVSADGSRVVWSVRSGHLYVRDMLLGQTVELDGVQGGSGEGDVSPVFQIASSDGSRVFFTDRQALTANSGAGVNKATGRNEPDLYECEMVVVTGSLKCVLSDLTPLGAGGEHADVLGQVVGASSDGSWVYFVANGALTEKAMHGNCDVFGPTGQQNRCNLYVWHAGATRLIAVLSDDDKNDWASGGLLKGMTARVSPDGEWVTFVSDSNLTGYDNRDAMSGKLDEEVYLYHAAGGGSLVCASCDPTGARPVGVEYGQIDLKIAGGSELFDKTQWVAAGLPGYTTLDGYAARYQPRYLSDSGRVFFNSSDGLVPQDVNGNEDVYQYEPPGVGGCTSGSVTFSGRSGGCVGLISSGGAAGESGFMDASETGSDVFFLTGAKLSSADFDTSLDVYDAHECTGVSPCLPVPAAVSPPCVTGDACKAAPTPQPVAFGAPSSATFSGAGNVTASGPGPVVRVKGLTRAQKLARALRACRKKRGRARSQCGKRARARYATRRVLKSAASVKVGG